jgi:hypothetical protein
MKLNKVVIWVIVAAVALFGIRIVMSRMNQESDQVLIERALAESIQASKEGRPGGVMDKLSKSLKFNELDTSGNRSQIAQYIKQNKPDVTVVNKKAVVSGEEARIISPVNIKIGFLGQGIERELKDVTMVFRKEEDREYLIFPTTKWKLAEVTVPDASVADFLQ